MADMGFLPEVRKILDLTPKDRQTLLFSATLDGDIDVLVRNYQRNPARHELAKDPADGARVTHLLLERGPRPARAAVRQDHQLGRPDHRVLPHQAGRRSGRPPARADRPAHRRHPRRPLAVPARAGARVVPPGPDRCPRGHRRRRPRHPRRRRLGRRAPRPAGRREGLRPPLGPHRPGRGRGRGRDVRGSRAAQGRHQDAEDPQDAAGHHVARRRRPAGARASGPQAPRRRPSPRGRSSRPAPVARARARPVGPTRPRRNGAPAAERSRPGAGRLPCRVGEARAPTSPARQALGPPSRRQGRPAAARPTTASRVGRTCSPVAPAAGASAGSSSRASRSSKRAGAPNPDKGKRRQPSRPR